MPREQGQGCGDLRAQRRSEAQLPCESPEAAPGSLSRDLALSNPIFGSDPGRESWPRGLHPGSNVDALRAWLREHKQPIYGTKQQLWRRALLARHDLLQKEAVQAELARQVEERRQGAPEMPAVPLRLPKPPTEAERSEHELTHSKFMPWFEFCVMGRGRRTRIEGSTTTKKSRPVLRLRWTWRT